MSSSSTNKPSATAYNSSKSQKKSSRRQSSRRRSQSSDSSRSRDRKKRTTSSSRSSSEETSSSRSSASYDSSRQHRFATRRGDDKHYKREHEHRGLARSTGNELDRFGQYLTRDSKYATSLHPVSSRDYRGQPPTGYYPNERDVHYPGYQSSDMYSGYGSGGMPPGGNIRSGRSAIEQSSSRRSGTTISTTYPLPGDHHSRYSNSLLSAYHSSNNLQAGSGKHSFATRSRSPKKSRARTPSPLRRPLRASKSRSRSPRYKSSTSTFSRSSLGGSKQQTLLSVSLGAELHKVLGEKRKHSVNNSSTTGVNTDTSVVKKTRMAVEVTSPVKPEKIQKEQSPTDSKKVRI